MYAQQSDLSGIFDTIGNIAKKVAGVADTVSSVAGTAREVQSDNRNVDVVDSNSPSIVLPVPGKPYGASIPVMPLLIESLPREGLTLLSFTMVSGASSGFSRMCESSRASFNVKSPLMLAFPPRIGSLMRGAE